MFHRPLALLCCLLLFPALALAQPKGAPPGADTAAAFIDYVASKEGQDVIRAFGKAQYGESLYNDADYAKKYD